MAAAGWDAGEEGAAAAARLAGIFSERPREHWLALAVERGLPLSAVRSVADAHAAGILAAAGLLEATPAPGGGSFASPGPFLPALGRTPATPVGPVGEHTERVLSEFGVP
jgi:crotonobetainyl-CoA:carnitine CoA-transferase CaiB-like acyl-CoA transferase